MTVQIWSNLSPDHQPIKKDVLLSLAQLDQSEFAWPWKFEDWAKLPSNNRKYLIVWKEACALALWELDNKPHAYLLKIMTASAMRKQGLASEAMINSVKWLKQHGFIDATLEVQVANQQAINFYHTHQWAPGRRIMSFYSDGSDALSMSLQL